MRFYDRLRLTALHLQQKNQIPNIKVPVPNSLITYQVLSISMPYCVSICQAAGSPHVLPSTAPCRLQQILFSCD